MQTMRKIIHIDMDCFYAAVEVRDNPKLIGKPVAVGGSVEKRGVLATCNYEAREYGLHSAMPTAQALKLCPHLTLLSGNMAKYRQVSESIRRIFKTYTHLVEPLSLDEAYLDVTDCPLYKGSATWIAESIREKIADSEGLTASAGVAPNKFLAKVASDWNKPNGIFVISPEQIDAFIYHLPVKKIHGVGRAALEKLTRLGVKTCGDLQRYDVTILNEIFGSFGQTLHQQAKGIDNREVKPNRKRKSVSVEHTLFRNTASLNGALEYLKPLIDKLQMRLERINQPIHKQFIKLKFADFTQTTNECISSSVDEAKFTELVTYAMNHHKKSVRLVGIGVRFGEADDIKQTSLLFGDMKDAQVLL
ncbi:DNA polymerase IV [Thiotrichales bacterium 19S3-7]|nr:DNA polymerase IV [Thiotrichales bacterium 19S3-7]MCF6802121.1 DNA polymerase IV [Thiotrichales bacterium 19S3-11]